MRTLQGWLLPVFLLPMAVYAQEATVKEVHDAPAVRGSIIANMLQEHDNPFTLYPYDTNYIIYTQTSDLDVYKRQEHVTFPTLRHWLFASTFSPTLCED